MKLVKKRNTQIGSGYSTRSRQTGEGPVANLGAKVVRKIPTVGKYIAPIAKAVGNMFGLGKKKSKKTKKSKKSLPVGPYMTGRGLAMPMNALLL